VLAPEMSFVVSLFGLLALAVALPPILRASAPRVRRVIVGSLAATPPAVLVAGGAWLAVTTSPAHLEAFIDGRWPAAESIATPAPPSANAVLAAAD